METLKLSNPATGRDKWMKYRKCRRVVILIYVITFNDLSLQKVEGRKRLDIALGQAKK
jgi:hypothetical protein